MSDTAYAVFWFFMGVIAGLALSLLITPASAATLTPWEPGASPCAGACSHEWAMAQTGAPDGEPVPLTIPAGTPIGWMSYARDGQPFGLDYHGRPTLRDLAAMGYPLGNGWWLVRIAECGNWAKVWLGGGAMDPTGAMLREAGVPESARPTAPPPGVPNPPGPTVTITDPPRVPVDREPPPDRERPDRKPPDVAPVPLPASGGLLAAALMWFAALMWRMRR
jgi:hypothetical protein